MNDMQSDTSSLCVPFTSNNVSRNALDIVYYYHSYQQIIILFITVHRMLDNRILRNINNALNHAS